jgi:RND family efflux transporter MFP subunit
VGVTLPAATAAVERAVRAGLVRRETDASDRRIVRVAVTPAGRRATARMKRLHEEKLRTVLESLSPRQRTQLVRLFERIHRILSTIDPSRPRGGGGIMLAVILAGAVLVMAGCPNNASKVPLAPRPVTQTAMTTVTVAAAEIRERPAFVRVTGSLIADLDSAVAARVGGIVKEVFVERGDVVTAGEPMVQLDPTDAENALAEGRAAAEEVAVRLGLDPAAVPEKFDPEQQPEVVSARSELELAQTNFERDKSLVANRTISQSDFDASRNKYEAARQAYNLRRHQALQLWQNYRTSLARIATLQQAVLDTTITAPFDGIVAEKLVSPGEYVAKGQQVVRLVSVNPLRLVLTVPEKQVSVVRERQAVEFMVGPYGDRVFTAQVLHISPALDTQSRALKVEAEAANPSLELRPGFFATARLLLPKDAPGLWVPATAVRHSGDFASVYMVRDGVARETVVGLGDRDGDWIEVRSGLAAGDRVVVEADRVSDGQRVE